MLGLQRIRLCACVSNNGVRNIERHYFYIFEELNRAYEECFFL